MVGFVVGAGLGIAGLSLIAYNTAISKKSKKTYEKAKQKYQKDLDDFKKRLEKYKDVPGYYRASVEPREPQLDDFVKEGNEKKVPKFVPYAVLGAGAILIAVNCVYPQDPREVVVVRNFGGHLPGTQVKRDFIQSSHGRIQFRTIPQII